MILYQLTKESKIMKANEIVMNFLAANAIVLNDNMLDINFLFDLDEYDADYMNEVVFLIKDGEDYEIKRVVLVNDEVRWADADDDLGGDIEVYADNDDEAKEVFNAFVEELLEM